MTRIWHWIACIAAMGAGPAMASQYGCTGLEEARDLPALEGHAGVIYRINADLRMYHPFSDQVVDQMGALSRALSAQGTTLLYVPVPTKSVAMPQYLPERAGLYGFDLNVATEVHTDILRRLAEAGVLAVDIRDAMRQVPADELAFFKSDFHWTTAGARAAAQAIAQQLRATPGYADAKKTQHETLPAGNEIAFSGMRRILQKRCRASLPQPQTPTFVTRAKAAALTAEGPLDLFGSASSGPEVALLGTSFSDSPINNFPGFLGQYSDLEVVNYAITGGNQFGAMLSYLTSEEFQQNRPRYLIWENPIYNNLAQFGDQPMRALIAAAGQNCQLPLPVRRGATPREISVDLRQIALDPAQTLFLDSDGAPALGVTYRFALASGRMREKRISRSARLRRTGRFYMPLTGLWPAGADHVTIALDADFGPAPRAFLCTDVHGG
ncbi:hypothetical protein N6L24_10455 [Cognatishimia sp. SS12]|uniref:alginate O-acetyltransferase AlgX-related protein n=1 Tax=Cognatishimia sp. SS12 TaxID=2979465 RepID=UPI00232D5FBF|nr:hypothetical protein [Cognatishimia sp. SS12]MDC0738702.1 hypothetical protein [Cognatishimia sp. SS12]